MNLDKLNKLVNSIKKDADNEQFSTDVLAAKISKVAVDHPNDMTLRQLSNTLVSMSKTGSMFISKANLNNLYERFYVKNTLADQVLANELSLAEEVGTNKFAAKSHAPIKMDISPLGNLFASILDKDFTPVYFDKKVAHVATDLVKSSLASQQLASSCTVLNGNPDVILVNACVETPKGKTSFYVPVEVQNGVALAPNRFIVDNGAVEFKYASAYVFQNQGVQVKTAGSAIYSTLLKKEGKHISSVDLALAKKNMADKEIANTEALRLKVQASAPAEKKVEYISVDKYAFSKKIATASGVAELQHGAKKVADCGSLIQSKLKNIGVKATSMDVSTTTPDSINFAVKVSTASFFVPVKTSGDKVFAPTVMVNNGNVMSFNKENVYSLIQNAEIDASAITAIASNSTLTVNDLVKEFKISLASNDIDRAEEVLTYLYAKNKTAHKEAVTLLMNTLSGKTVTASGCSAPYMKKTSAFPICSHTGLPVNKVAQDAQGDCIALTSVYK